MNNIDCVRARSNAVIRTGFRVSSPSYFLLYSALIHYYKLVHTPQCKITNILNALVSFSFHFALNEKQLTTKETLYQNAQMYPVSLLCPCLHTHCKHPTHFHHSCPIIISCANTLYILILIIIN
jgi:hypothetical protein